MEGKNKTNKQLFTAKLIRLAWKQLKLQWMSNWIKPKQRMHFVHWWCDGINSNSIVCLCVCFVFCFVFFNFFRSAIRLRLMSSGTSDTWWPGSFLQIDLWVQMETELVQVISGRRSNSRGRKFKSWCVRFPRCILEGTFTLLLQWPFQCKESHHLGGWGGNIPAGTADDTFQPGPANTSRESEEEETKTLPYRHLGLMLISVKMLIKLFMGTARLF